MKINHSTYTVESVASGHPDKICDQISDAVLDECLRQDENSRVAVETFGGHGLLVVCGEVTTKAEFNAEKIARKAYADIGHKDELKVIVNIVKQSPDIAMGVDAGGAGDQGIMYGFACDETSEFLPEGLVKVHCLAAGLEKLRKENAKYSWLRPDGKAQITVEQGEVKTVLVSCQHKAETEHDFIEQEIVTDLISPLFNNETSKIKVLVNPTGRFVQGGFEADTGLTGRKIMVDTYGGLAPHGGGCFSGKDPSKVDRSAAYMARFAAKNIVANGFAKKCLVSVAYAIGKAEPLMVFAVDEESKDISELVNRNFDFRPKAIIERLGLRRPIYQKTATFGHFGKSGLPWEEIVEI